MNDFVEININNLYIVQTNRKIDFFFSFIRYLNNYVGKFGIFLIFKIEGSYIFLYLNN